MTEILGKVLVTGGFGFLGQHLMHLLLEENKTKQLDRDIIVLDLNENKSMYQYDFESIEVKLITDVDISSPGDIDHFFKDVETVFHLAALIRYGRRNRDMLDRINILGTQEVIQACRKNKVKNLIHIGSIAVVGYDKKGITLGTEESKINWEKDSSSYYGYSKKKSVDLVLQCAVDDLRVVVAHPGIMLGPGDLKSLPLYQIGKYRISAAPGGGTNFIDVRDVARGLISLQYLGEPGSEYLLTSHNRTHKELFKLIAKHFGKKSYVAQIHSFVGIIISPIVGLLEFVMPKSSMLSKEGTVKAFHKRFFSNEKAKKELGWRPEYSLEQTIEEAVVWLESEGKL
ncbi:MAG: dTDP-glucose 4,6-dehydratase [Candidatus Heimdallarchaeota archaeon LC_2]|nr:MAG: dTDP-glucose 4,6-dehydratase [Candidatus Heimdallarchaeota archaeon LC_2]